MKDIAEFINGAKIVVDTTQLSDGTYETNVFQADWSGNIRNYSELYVERHNTCDYDGAKERHSEICEQIENGSLDLGIKERDVVELKDGSYAVVSSILTPDAGFETMIFASDKDGNVTDHTDLYVEHYDTKEEMAERHTDICEQIEKGEVEIIFNDDAEIISIDIKDSEDKINVDNDENANNIEQNNEISENETAQKVLDYLEANYPEIKDIIQEAKDAVEKENDFVEKNAEDIDIRIDNNDKDNINNTDNIDSKDNDWNNNWDKDADDNADNGWKDIEKPDSDNISANELDNDKIDRVDSDNNNENVDFSGGNAEYIIGNWYMGIETDTELVEKAIDYLENKETDDTELKDMISQARDDVQGYKEYVDVKENDTHNDEKDDIENDNDNIETNYEDEYYDDDPID